MGKKQVCKQLANIDNLIYFSIENPIRCGSKDFSPIFVDFKKVLHCLNTRKSISSNLLKIVDKNIDSICGLESGGNYYASCVADKLNKPVIFFRKNKKNFKNYNNEKRIAGNILNVKSIALIDDVLATGLTAKDAIEYFKKYNISCHLYTIFTYGHNKAISKKLNIKINSLITFNDLAHYTNFLNENDIKIIKKHISNYNKYLK